MSVMIDSQDYEAFLARKVSRAAPVGFDIRPEDLNPHLFPFQRPVTAWAVRRGRAALFLDTGLGKSVCFLDWGEQVIRKTLRPVLILAPLAVSHQIAREGQKFGIPVKVARHQDECGSGLNVTNYEKLPHFRPDAFGGLVCDESSCLKGDGPLRESVTAFAREIPYRLAASATPAPNDTQEIVNHAEFLGIRSGKEVLAEFFTQDGNTTHKWRVKKWADKGPFWEWLASWAVAVQRPSDLGFSDDGFLLPPLNLSQHTVEVDVVPAEQGALFAVEALTLKDQRAGRRQTLTDRVAVAADLATVDRSFLVWCDLNAESEALAAAIPGAVEVKGADSPEHKERAMLGFADGSVRCLVSKPSICGYGMNWQHCADMAFVGLSHSAEQLYQATRRCWRFGQTQAVNVHVITAETDGAIVRNIERKQGEAAEMMRRIIRYQGDLLLAGAASREEQDYRPTQAMRLPRWLGASA